MWLFLLIVIGIALAASLPIAGGRWGRMALVGILAAIGAIGVLAVFWVLQFYSTEQLVGGYADNLASAFGVSPLLAKAATLALVLPAGMALAWVFLFSGTKRRWGRSVLAGAGVLYFLALWVAMRARRSTSMASLCIATS